MFLILLLWEAERYRPGQPVHLPEVPADDVDHFPQEPNVRLCLEPSLIVLDHRIQYIHPRNQQVVPLKLIAIGALERPQRPFKPFSVIGGVLIYYPQLTVQNADAVLDGDDFARGGIIAGDHIGRLAAGDFKAFGIHIGFP